MNIGPGFNQPLDYLPTTLTRLSIQTNQYLDYLPASLVNLTILIHNFSRPLDFLPEGLQTLCLFAFEGNLDYLPSTLLELDMVHYGMDLSHQFDHLPAGLQSLKIHGFNNLHNLLYLPPHLHQLWILFADLPGPLFHDALMNLKKLHCSLKNITQPITWPLRLTHLSITDQHPDFGLGVLPETLEYLMVDNLDNSLGTRWPNSLKYLCIRENIIASTIPLNKIEYIFSYQWHKVLNQVNFPHLKQLTIQHVVSGFSWDDFEATQCHDYDFCIHNGHICLPSIPSVWPLKLFYLSVDRVHITVDAPWKEPSFFNDFIVNLINFS